MDHNWEMNNMNAAEYRNPDSLPDTYGGYTHVVKVGSTVYIAGQMSADTGSDMVHAGDLEAQTRQVWHNLEEAVKAAGGTLQDIVKTTTFVTDADHFTVIRNVRNELWNNLKMPANTMVVAKSLANPEYLVAIEAIAVVD